jgi:hypothetical protein
MHLDFRKPKMSNRRVYRDIDEPQYQIFLYVVPGLCYLLINIYYYYTQVGEKTEPKK